MNIPVDSSDRILYIPAALEASHEESKKEFSQFHRFANSQNGLHSWTGDVREALKSLQPDQLHEILKKTGRSLSGAGSNLPVDRQDIPKLKVPVGSQNMAYDMDSDLSTKSEAVSYSSTSAEMTALIGRVNQLSVECSLEKMVSKLQAFNATMNGAGKAYSNLAADLEAQGLHWAGNADTLRAAYAHAETLEQMKFDAQSRLDEAHSTLKTLQVKAETQEPQSALLQLQLIAANIEVTAALSAMNGTSKNYENYVIAVLNPAIAAKKLAQERLNSTLGQAKSLIASLSVQQHSIIQNLHHESVKEAKSLTFLIALMSQLISQNSSEHFSALTLLIQKLSEAAAKYAEKQAQEYAIEVRKAEDLQNSMGLASKIFGWVASFLCFAASALTGGATFVLGVALLGVMAVDEGYRGITGYSFIQEGMEPFMEYIVQPLIKFYSDIYTAIAIFVFEDEELAERIGQFMGTIAAILIIIACTLLIGSAVGKIVGSMASKLADKIGEKMLKRIMDLMFMQVLRSFYQGAGSVFNMSALRISQISYYTQMAAAVITLANSIIQTAGSIAAADMLVEAAKARAKLIENSALQEIIQSILNQAEDAFRFNMEAVNKILEDISYVAENQMQAGKYITNKMSHVAG
ncbi:type III secretion system translocon subunit SctE [Erwinia pyrifoliae]|uniref:Type III secretion system translocon subunit SctE n=1 Tax=Erwinia pyrifoliae TaxID=79967 RepID=A0ABY5XD99_ERWPY|nr:type III secretion system translocon subunit SctE [Erwinia pyrifoliae]AUX72545.1 cell division protein FtsQ [Erwinia pyrifoliae]MCA8877201.1 cell division protein FtsQ [Erwinia pyrifoliae]MCT2387384.1 type III secretion system translocon subunit SctE [Erwinia pyrifoliae]MCU8587016.1 type III secretion system translocon subunit SctE [Erwinia pyrifoliae]UWS30883.1 type III secretion system translocon subunit SctE [Erwinia pyrifoliae]